MLRVDINLLFTVINLIILVVAMRIFLFKPVHKILKERQELVDKSINDAENAKLEAEKLKTERSEQLSRADAEGREILSAARKKASDEYERIVSGAENRASGIIKNAEAEGERVRGDIISKAQEEVNDMVVSAASKLFAREGTDSDIYDEFLAKSGEEHD